MNALARYENRHQNMNRHNYGMPTIFDIFSRPLTDFETMFSQMPEDNIKLDVQDCGDHYQIKADMPGVKKEDIKLDFDEGNLIIKAEHHTNKEKKDAEGLRLAMIEMINSPEKRSEFSKNGREYAVGNFEQNALFGKILEDRIRLLEKR